MLMMLACLAHWRRGVAADAHDAGLSGWLYGKRGAADAHDAGVLGSLEKVGLMLMMLACPAVWG